MDSCHSGSRRVIFSGLRDLCRRCRDSGRGTLWREREECCKPMETADESLLCTHYRPPEEMELREVPSPVPGRTRR